MVLFTWTQHASPPRRPSRLPLPCLPRSFVRQFEDRPAEFDPDAEADSVKVQDFLARMEAAFRVHPAWRGASGEVLDQAVEGLEKYLMSKLFSHTFAASSEDRDRDERYVRLTTALAFVSLSTLIGVEVEPDEALMASAQGELLRMDRYKAPRDKLLCLVNVKTLVEDIVGAAARGGAPVGGADAFFPVFLLVIVRSRMPRLASNVEYIRRFRGRPRLSGQFDFMLCNLESVAVYLDTVDWRHLKVPQDEFLARLAEAGLPEAEMELRALRAAEAAAEAAGGGEGVQQSIAGTPAAGEDGDMRPDDTGQVAAAAVVDQQPAAVVAEEMGGTAAVQQELPDITSAEEVQPSSAATTTSPAAANEGQAEAGSAQLDGSASGAAGSVEDRDSTPSPSGKVSEVVTSVAQAGGAASIIPSEPKPSASSPVDVSGIPPSSSTVGSTRAGGPGPLELPPSPLEPSMAFGTSQFGLTPVGGLPTPSLLVPMAQSLPLKEEPPAPPPAASQAPSPPPPLPSFAAVHGGDAAPSPAPLIHSVLDDMVLEGTSLVLEEEAAGRLQQRHPWVYASAEDLSVVSAGGGRP